jgi:large exoprotein involved in heme utilization and adhesion
VNVTGDGGGFIAIKGRNINFTSESILLADTLADKNGGEISIVGDSIAFNRSSLLSNTFGSGNGGQIKLEANNIKFENRSGVNIQTSDRGNAGNINVRANSLGIEGGTGFVSRTTGTSTGKAGDINITVNGPMAITYTGINADSYGTGSAGKINISANSLQIDDSLVTSTVGKAGQAGEIKFNVADSLTINKSVIRTNTSGTGDAGKINITAGSFRLKGVISSQALQNSTGRGGEINITAGSLEVLKNPGEIAFISTDTYGKGDAGDINVSVTGPLTLAGISITTESSGAGNAGKININANSSQIENSAVTSSVTNTSTGQGGEINFHVADSLTINKSGIRTNTSGTGDAGKININANSFQLKGEIRSEAQGSSTGRGGEINITANSLELPKNPDPKDYTLISTTTAGIGDAGNINILVKGSLTVASGAKINEITTNSFGNGKAGDLKISADTIKLDNSSLNADTRGGKGNITLNSGDLILRNNSKITANATGTADGGNISINTGNLVLENSGITARAESGLNGNVVVRAKSFFRSPDSDVTATSVLGPQLFIEYVDPSQGLFELTETVIDPAQQVAQNPCVKGFGSTFTITGRGGLPSDPNKILSSDNVRVDLVEPVPSKVSSTTATEKKPSQQPPVKRIIPAQGWIYNDKGQVVLVAYDPTKTGPQREQPAPTSNCAAVR